MQRGHRGTCSNRTRLLPSHMLCHPNRERLFCHFLWAIHIAIRLLLRGLATDIRLFVRPAHAMSPQRPRAWNSMRLHRSSDQCLTTHFTALSVDVLGVSSSVLRRSVPPPFGASTFARTSGIPPFGFLCLKLPCSGAPGAEGDGGHGRC